MNKKNRCALCCRCEWTKLKTENKMFIELICISSQVVIELDKDKRRKIFLLLYLIIGPYFIGAYWYFSMQAFFLLNSMPLIEGYVKKVVRWNTHRERIPRVHTSLNFMFSAIFLLMTVHLLNNYTSCPQNQD